MSKKMSNSDLAHWAHIIKLTHVHVEACGVPLPATLAMHNAQIIRNDVLAALHAHNAAQRGDGLPHYV